MTTTYSEVPLHNHDGGDISGSMPFVRVVAGVNIPALASRVPKGVLGYAIRTSSIDGLSGGPVDLPDLSVEVSVPAGRVIRVVGFVWAWSGPNQGEQADLMVREGNTQLNKKRVVAAAANRAEGGAVEALILPSAGTHTYKLSFLQITGSSDWRIEASSNGPAYILVEDLGADPNA